MENYDIITQMITSIGFPIVFCLLMWWQMFKQQEQHSKDMEKVTTALNNNTVALERLIEKLDK